MKSKSKSARIPETVHYEQRYRSNCSEQAEMFNEYFSKQFSEPSVYDTDIDFKNACALNNLQFHELDVLLILKSTNPSKAAGPDGIHGMILKNCACSLAKPLTMLFNQVYVTGCIPVEWKLALILGPLLFVLFINDIKKAIRLLLKTIVLYL